MRRGRCGCLLREGVLPAPPFPLPRRGSPRSGAPSLGPAPPSTAPIRPPTTRETPMHLDHSSDTFPHRHTYSTTPPSPLRPDGTRRALRIGLGGPVGSGK